MLLKTALPRILPWAIVALFLLLITWQIVPMFMNSAETPLNSSNQPASDPRLQEIIAGEIFGVFIESSTNETAGQTNNNATPQATSLPYVLKGVITAATPEKGSAIIELSPGDSRYFSAGREITNNVKLAAVHRDHIVIDNQGQNETLQLAELSLSMANPSSPSSSFGDALNTNSGNTNSSININTSTPADNSLPSRDERDDSSENTQDREDMIKRDRIRQRLEELRARNPS